MLPHIHDEMRRGWEEFIKLPADKKTKPMAHYHQARYQVLKELLSWLKEEIRAGKQSAEVLEAENKNYET